jgi:hypothetical protein
MTDKPSIQEEIGTTYRSITYLKITCTKIYITIAYREDDPEKIEFVRIFGTTRTNNCPNSFFESLADLLTFSIRRIRNEHEAKSIVKNLRHQKCLNCPVNKDHTTSCSDAIGQVLEDVLKTNEKADKKEEAKKD